MPERPGAVSRGIVGVKRVNAVVFRRDVDDIVPNSVDLDSARQQRLRVGLPIEQLRKDKAEILG
jgi:hypothetical protein